MNDSIQIASVLLELEIIACSLDDAAAAYEGGASRLGVTVRLDLAGLTPPAELVHQIVGSLPIPIRAMLLMSIVTTLFAPRVLRLVLPRVHVKQASSLGPLSQRVIKNRIRGRSQVSRFDLARIAWARARAPRLSDIRPVLR